MSVIQLNPLISSKLFVATLYDFSEDRLLDILSRFRALPGCGSAKLSYDKHLRVFEIEHVFEDGNDVQCSLINLLSEYIRRDPRNPATDGSLHAIEASKVHHEAADELDVPIEELHIRAAASEEPPPLWTPSRPTTCIETVLLSDLAISLQEEVSCQLRLACYNAAALSLHPLNGTLFSQTEIHDIISRLNVIEKVLDSQCCVKHISHLLKTTAGEFKLRNILLSEIHDGSLSRTIYPVDWRNIRDNPNGTIPSRRQVIRLMTSNLEARAHLPEATDLTTDQNLTEPSLVSFWTAFDTFIQLRSIGITDHTDMLNEEQPSLTANLHEQTNRTVESWMDKVETSLHPEDSIEHVQLAEYVPQTNRHRHTLAQSSSPSLPKHLSSRPSPEMEFASVKGKGKQDQKQLPSNRTKTELTNRFACMGEEDLDDNMSQSSSKLNILQQERETNDFIECEEQLDEPDTRLRIANNKKKKPRQAPGRRNGTSVINVDQDRIKKAMNKHVEQCIRHALDAALGFRGQIEIIVEIGQILLPNSQTYLDPPVGWAEAVQFLSNIAGFDQESKNFTNAVRVTANGLEDLFAALEIDYQQPYFQEATWELTCTTVNKEAVKICIDAAKSQKPRNAKVLVDQKSFGATYFHGLDAIYDAYLSIKGITATEDLKNFPGLARLVESLYVRPTESRTSSIPSMTGRDCELFVELIRLRLSMRYALPRLNPAEDQCYMEIAQMHDLSVRRPKAQDSRYAGLFEGYFPEDEEYIQADHLWHEIRLGQVHPPPEWDENMTLPAGKEAAWEAAKAISDQSLNALERNTRRLLDCVNSLTPGS